VAHLLRGRVRTAASADDVDTLRGDVPVLRLGVIVPARCLMLAEETTVRRQIFVVLVLAVTAGGGLAYATYSFMQKADAPSQAVAMTTQSVVMASADLSLGAEITADRLRVVQFPKGEAPEGAFANPSDVVGRAVISAIVRNEPILPGKLAPREAGPGLPPAIPPGMRAVSVRVNDVISVAGYVLPGTHVDVLATASPTQQVQDTTTKVVLTNVPVLAAGTRLEQDQKDGKPVQVSVVTLLVSPEQSERLALASTEGKVQLALRNPLDTGTPDTPGIKPAALLSSRTLAAPPPRANRPAARAATTQAAAAPPPPQTVEVIRGDKRVHEVIR
jgi:pilus assembly protein CpaB